MQQTRFAFAANSLSSQRWSIARLLNNSLSLRKVGLSTSPPGFGSENLKVSNDYSAAQRNLKKTLASGRLSNNCSLNNALPVFDDSPGKRVERLIGPRLHKNYIGKLRLPHPPSSNGVRTNSIIKGEYEGTMFFCLIGGTRQPFFGCHIWTVFLRWEFECAMPEISLMFVHANYVRITIREVFVL